MSRAVNVDDSVQAVTDLCVKLAVGISDIEPLQSGGTRVVFHNSVDAEKMRRRLNAKLILGPVVRSPLYAWRTTAPYS